MKIYLYTVSFYILIFIYLKHKIHCNIRFLLKLVLENYIKKNKFVKDNETEKFLAQKKFWLVMMAFISISINSAFFHI